MVSGRFKRLIREKEAGGTVSHALRHGLVISSLVQQRSRGQLGPQHDVIPFRLDRACIVLKQRLDPGLASPVTFSWLETVASSVGAREVVESASRRVDSLSSRVGGFRRKVGPKRAVM